MLVRRYELNVRERDILLVGLCDAHSLLEYDVDPYYNRRNFLVRIEEAAAYLGCAVNDILPLVRDDSKLVACGLLDNDLTPSRDALEYLEGHVTAPSVRASSRFRLSKDDFKIIDDWVNGDDDDE